MPPRVSPSGRNPFGGNKVVRETGSVLCQTALWDCFGNASFIGYYKVARETRSVLCQTALWDCFGNAIASFIGYYKVARETGGACHLTENFGNSG